MSVSEHVANDVWRRVWPDCVTFQPAYLRTYEETWYYAVFKYPFVPGFHVCESDHQTEEYVLSTHKTLHEAMGILKVLLANGGTSRDWSI